MSTALLSVRELSKSYAAPGWVSRTPRIQAVDRVSFDIGPGETLGLVGESGSGKSTLGRLVMQLEQADAGEVVFDGHTLTGLSRRQVKPFRQKLQMVFQDPYGALNPRMRAGELVAEPLGIFGLTRTANEQRERTAELLRLVGLDPAMMARFPHEFSGGQRQRINIARALSTNPSLIVADEPITALDVSIQAQIINLFQDLQASLGLSYLFIAHDLGMVRYLCQRVAVMLRGRIVETAPADQLFEDPRHPYTQALLSAVPIPNPRLERQRQRLSFDPATHQPAPDAALREVAPGHFVLQ